LRVIVKEALANGRLTERGGLPGVVEAAREAGTTPDVLALAAVLAQDWCDLVLSGAATVAELDSNLGAAELAVDPDALARFEALREAPDVYWETRAALKWN
jgi:aryl-alcohol dehydrogenase-like predicted oxidoreductase